MILSYNDKLWSRSSYSMDPWCNVQEDEFSSVNYYTRSSLDIFILMLVKL